MVAVPIFGDRYTQPVRREITTLTEPARTELTHLQLALALEGAVLDDFLETRDTTLLQRFRQVHRQEENAYQGLSALVNRLGPEVRRRFDELRELDTRRHVRANQLIAFSRTRIAGGDPAHKGLYEDALLAAAQLDETLNDATQARRDRVIAAERIERSLTIVLGFLALAAIIVVVWLGQRLRVAATEAEQRRLALAAALEGREKLMRGVSHDLKNPLNAIDGHAQLLEDGVKGPLTPEQKESIGRIRRAVQTQLSLIVDLLELSRAESGSLAIHKEPTDVCAVVAEEIEEQRAAAEAAGHTLAFVPNGEKPVVETDPERVKQVLGNLLSNAVKYTPARGRIEVKVETTEGSGRLAGRRAIAIRVADTGHGVPPEKIDAIFEEFTRLAPGLAEGAGLGLAIARRISRLLGGDITMVSEVGEGSVFSLWLPHENGSRPRANQLRAGRSEQVRSEGQGVADRGRS
jgi:signal transduction histidine kinase